MTAYPHPIRALEREVGHLHELEREGDSAETPLLAMLGLASFLLPLAGLMMLVAFGVAWLVTGHAV
jgi:hypothetical protein